MIGTDLERGFAILDARRAREAKEKTERNEMEEDNLRLKLKSAFKNDIADGLKIYYSGTRPVNQIFNYLPDEVKDNAQIWEEDENFLISMQEIPKEVLNNLELREFDFNLMDMTCRRIVLNYEALFDVCGYNLKEFLEYCKVKEKAIYGKYDGWVNVEDCLNTTKWFIEEYFDKEE